MAEQYIEIGSDKQLTLTVLGANGSALDLSGYEGYGVTLYYKDTNVVIEKYSSNVVTGWNNTDIDTSSEASGIIYIDFRRAYSELGREGAQVYFKVQIQSTDADYASSQFRDLTGPAYCFTYRGGGVAATTDLS